MRVYPSGFDAYGNDVLIAHAQHHFGGRLEDGLILILVDAWVFNPAPLTRANVAFWCPVDHEPVPPKVLEVLAASQGTPIAMSRFGERMLTQAGLSPLYVPHGIDTDVYRPYDRQEARRIVGLPEEGFIVGMVAANKGNVPPRKGWNEAVAAFARLRAQHDDALLYMHTEMQGVVHGVNLPALLQAYGVPLESVRFCDQYRYLTCFPPEFVAQAYSAMDVLLNPAWGEGFGIPVVEAQACGTPVIVTDCSAMSELGQVGWQVKGDRFFTDQRAFMTRPDVDSLAWALEQAYQHGGSRERAREFALAYDADRVFETYWTGALETIEARMLAPAEPVAA